MPEYEKITFENGFRLLLSEDGRAKSCSMGVWVGSGSCYESDDTAGISHFIEHMVFKGSALYSSEDIASISDRMGGELNAFTNYLKFLTYEKVYLYSLWLHLRR